MQLRDAGELNLGTLGNIDVSDAVSDHLVVVNNAIGDQSLASLARHSSGVGGATKDSAAGPDWDGTSVAAYCLDEGDPECILESKKLASPSYAFSQYEQSESAADLGQPSEDMETPSVGIYSNVGYSVLGAVVDVVGNGYEEFIWNNIGNYASTFSSDNMLTLALAHSWRANDIPKRASGHKISDGWFEVNEFWDAGDLADLEGWQGPAGGWSMTIGDLTRFAVALNEKGLVSNDSLEMMREKSTTLLELGAVYGIGLFHGEDSSGGLGSEGPAVVDPVYWHGGDIAGGHAAVWTYWPYIDGGSLSVNLICNREIGSGSLKDLAAEIAFEIAGTSPSSLVAVYQPVDAARVVGQFAIDHTSGWHANQTNGDKRFFVPLSGIEEPLALDVTTTRDELSFEFVAGERHYPVVVDYSANPRFVGRPIDVSLNTPLGMMPIQDLAISGSIAENGEVLADIGLRGILDARDVSPLIGMSEDAICMEAGGCQTCDDGVHACLAVEYQGIDGRRTR